MSGNVALFEAAPAGPVPLEQVAIRLHPADHVAIAKQPLAAGTQLLTDEGPLTLRAFIGSGHKLALVPAAAGEPLRRYGQIIGFATADIAAGDHVHSHNLAVGIFDRDYAFGVDVGTVDYVPEAERRTFMGYRRPDGRVGTRNYIGVISTVNCSAHVVREIAHAFDGDRLKHYPNVDGVIALAHLSGCGLQLGGADYALLQRTLAGMACHPNIGAYIIVGLGCEMNQVSDLIANYSLGAEGFTRSEEHTSELQSLE